MEVWQTKEPQPYPDHPERFDQVLQVMCREAVTGRCYWEVEWRGIVNIGVAYKSIKRKGMWHTAIEISEKAWCVNIIVWSGYSFHHRLSETYVPVPIINVKAFLARPRKLGVYVDWPAGILSFYSLSGDKKHLLYTFHTTFSEPLYPVFTINPGSLTLSSSRRLTMGHVSNPACLIAPSLDGITRKSIFISFMFFLSGFQAQSSFTPEVIPDRIGVSYR